MTDPARTRWPWLVARMEPGRFYTVAELVELTGLPHHSVANYLSAAYTNREVERTPVAVEDGRKLRRWVRTPVRVAE